MKHVDICVQTNTRNFIKMDNLKKLLVLFLVHLKFRIIFTICLSLYIYRRHWQYTIEMQRLIYLLKDNKQTFKHSCHGYEQSRLSMHNEQYP